MGFLPHPAAQHRLPSLRGSRPQDAGVLRSGREGHRSDLARSRGPEHHREDSLAVRGGTSLSGDLCRRARRAWLSGLCRERAADGRGLSPGRALSWDHVARAAGRQQRGEDALALQERPSLGDDPGRHRERPSVSALSRPGAQDRGRLSRAGAPARDRVGRAHLAQEHDDEDAVGMCTRASLATAISIRSTGFRLSYVRASAIVPPGPAGSRLR